MIAPIQRRTLLTVATAAAAASEMIGLTQAAAQTVSQNAPGTTYVLVHGSWHGGWCWTRVTDRLLAAGYRVYTPTFTGLADWSHLLSRSVTMQTHVADLVNLFEWYGITDAVLVAHSFAGWSVSAALEQIGDRVRSIVFLDAFYPADGERPIDMQSDASKRQMEAAIDAGEIGRAPFSAAAFGVTDAVDAAWVTAKMTPQPYGTYTEPVHLTGARERVAKKTYVRATQFPSPVFDAAFTKLQKDPTWQTHAFTSGHDMMVTIPDQVTQLLIEAA